MTEETINDSQKGLFIWMFYSSKNLISCNNHLIVFCWSYWGTFSWVQFQAIHIFWSRLELRNKGNRWSFVTLRCYLSNLSFHYQYFHYLKLCRLAMLLNTSIIKNNKKYIWRFLINHIYIRVRYSIFLSFNESFDVSKDGGGYWQIFY